jgi:hypothetical protein
MSTEDFISSELAQLTAFEKNLFDDLNKSVTNTVTPFNHCNNDSNSNNNINNTECELKVSLANILCDHCGKVTCRCNISSSLSAQDKFIKESKESIQITDNSSSSRLNNDISSQPPTKRLLETRYLNSVLFLKYFILLVGRLRYFYMKNMDRYVTVTQSFNSLESLKPLIPFNYETQGFLINFIYSFFAR